jgi:hypothetical protein
MNRVIQGNLLKIAAGFLILQTLIITLSPAVRARTIGVDYRWSQWVALVVWLVVAYRVHQAIALYLPDADPYLFPVAALLTGWGLLTVWRLDSSFGARQSLWFGISAIGLIGGLHLPTTLAFLRKYKYLLLTGGLILTALTLIFGTNPIGYGPRLWLGCCGVFFQPSEPLKLLLVGYLAAYLAERIPIRLRGFALVYPTLLLSGIAILLLLFQRDLGTASIFIALFTVILYLATGRGRIIIGSLIFLGFVAVIGYYIIDIIQARIDAWLNPWEDPSGGAYQIGKPGSCAGCHFGFHFFCRCGRDRSHRHDRFDRLIWSTRHPRDSRCPTRPRSIQKVVSFRNYGLSGDSNAVNSGWQPSLASAHRCDVTLPFLWRIVAFDILPLLALSAIDHQSFG